MLIHSLFVFFWMTPWNRTIMRKRRNRWKKIHNSLLQPMVCFIYFHVGKKIRSPVFPLKWDHEIDLGKRASWSPEHAVTASSLLQQLSLNTGYGLYWSYTKMTNGLHISLHTSLFTKPIVTCQMQPTNWTGHWWTRPPTNHWKHVDAPWLNWNIWL